MASSTSIWLIMLTPLQLKNTMAIVNKCDVEIIFYDQIISKTDLKNEFPKAKLVILPSNIFRKNDLLASPFNSLKLYRKQVLKYKSLVKQYTNNNKGSVILYCGSDKNIYLQILANSLKKGNKLKKLISVDEGIGHYGKVAKYGALKKQIYKLISVSLLGVKYDYIDTLGTWDLVNDVWVRWPDLVQNKSPKATYHKIPNKERPIKHSSSLDLKKVLILSTPLSVDRRTTLKDEEILFNQLVNEMTNNNYKVAIKPHPRDSERKFDAFLKGKPKLEILGGDTVAEEINYWEYSYIVSFGSSVVMDILDSGYPPDRIITIDIMHVTQKIPFFNITQVFNTFEEFREEFKF